MKVQVTEKAKGELFVRAIGKTMKSGSIITLTDDQFYDSATQAAVHAGLLSIMDGPDKKESKGEEYINVYKNSLSFKCIRRTIPSGSSFFVCEELLDEPEIVSAFNLGYIQFANILEPDSDIEENKEEEVKISKKKSVSKSSKISNRTSKSSKKSSSNTKKIKRVGSDKDSSLETDVKVSVGKPPKETEMDGEPTDTYALPKKSQVEIPKGMYSHDPTGEGMSVRRANGKQDFSDESNFIDSSEKHNEISFVDKEQTRERAKKNGISSDIFNSNLEVE